MNDPLQALQSANTRRLGWAQTKRQLKSGDLTMTGAHAAGFPATIRAMEVVGLAVVGHGTTTAGGYAGRLALHICREANLTHYTFAAALSAQRWEQLQAILDYAVTASGDAPALTAAS